MQKPELWKLVLLQLGCTESDPSAHEWRSFVNRALRPEIKQECQRFYGNYDEQESLYAGLDYANRNHRLRLEPFPNHNRLFKVFDKLRLSDQEIYHLCRWRGTKKAKDDFETKHDLRIVDTTWEDVELTRHREPTVTIVDWQGVRTAPIKTPQNTYGGEIMGGRASDNIMDDHSDDTDEGSEDELHQSVGFELNQRLIGNADANARALARGEPALPMDAQYEEWMKEAAERDAAEGTTTATSALIEAQNQNGVLLRSLSRSPPRFAGDSLQSVSIPHANQASVGRF